MSTKFPNVFSPVQVRGYTYKNRLIAAPTLFAHAVYFIPEIAENVYRMVENRAKGGFAAVSTGEIGVNSEEARCLFMDRPVDFGRYEGSDFDKMKEYADRIKKHGAIAYLEFCHEGVDAVAQPPYSPVGPDAFVRYDGVKVKAIDKPMMQKITDDFVRIALFAKACGFNGILIHGGHGFLFQQFMSPLQNHRTDEFGGSIENRARFPMMILDAVREAIGEEMIMELRFSAEDGLEGGMTIDDTVEFCKLIDGKVDIIQVSNGSKYAGNRTNTFSDIFDVHGVNVGHAEKIKKAVKKSLVAVIGGINAPEQAEEIIASGKADFVEVGRQGFADPAFPNKALKGEEDTIRRCVRCFQCYPGFCEHPTDKPLTEKGYTPEQVAKLYNPASMGSCSINPNSGFGYYEDRMPAPQGSRNVLIVGGGPGGMQAAITAVQRGHRVTLVEKTGRLGGIINFTDTDEDKVDLRNFKNLLIRETQKSGAQIRMNRSATAELIQELQPDVIIAAVGSRPLVPPIPGIEKAINALDIYSRQDEIGKKVVMAGGGMVGCEVGLFLADKGCDVTVIEMQDAMANETFGYYRNALMDELDKRSVHQMLKTKCLGFTDSGVKVLRDGREEFVEADTMVFSMGMTPNAQTVEQIRKAAGEIPVKAIGDCGAVGKVGDAVRGGYMAAMEII
ncbi:oxidoreductase [Parasporobacterium paucivorans]|uniref:2,4-dienoyl-CoA reductase n=1 Tax=Parasporobacterium paucivorans DSM 15970 TaxID=1122934 RepID=A0A1M6E7N4_9FIRM|nr:FAD-dependent oxidoreductase [Parasporobacterium paucivorans]SHI81506.1 2,4-dienoyl-CoA reductase [Parasporobacterium paucivorans DSM 15970]